MDSVFDKQRLAKARSFATICDRVTMSMAMPEMSHVAARKGQYDRVSADEANENNIGKSAASSTLISMMTIEVVVEFLEKQALYQKYQDGIISTYFMLTAFQNGFIKCYMLHCDQDHESWTRKCEYTRNFIWNIIKRLAHLWLSTNHPAKSEIICLLC